MNGESKGIKEGNKLSIFTQTDKMYLEYKKLSGLTLKKEKKSRKWVMTGKFTKELHRWWASM